MPCSIRASRSEIAPRADGFTLIEVLIVIAIIGILAAVAIPAYSDYVRRGQLPEAFGTLSDFRAKMEQYYQDNRNYGSSAKCASDSSADSWNGFAPSTAKYFTYKCETTNSQQGFKITATGSSGRAVGNEYTINQNGDRTTTKYKNNTVSGKGCWLTSSSDC